jgi:hypothetical protein
VTKLENFPDQMASLRDVIEELGTLQSNSRLVCAYNVAEKQAQDVHDSFVRSQVLVKGDAAIELGLRICTNSGNNCAKVASRFHRQSEEEGL